MAQCPYFFTPADWSAPSVCHALPEDRMSPGQSQVHTYCLSDNHPTCPRFELARSRTAPVLVDQSEGVPAPGFFTAHAQLLMASTTAVLIGLSALIFVLGSQGQPGTISEVLGEARTATPVAVSPTATPPEGR